VKASIGYLGKYYYYNTSFNVKIEAKRDTIKIKIRIKINTYYANYNEDLIILIAAKAIMKTFPSRNEIYSSTTSAFFYLIT